MTFVPFTIAVIAVITAQEAGMRSARGQIFTAFFLITLALAMAIGAGFLAHGPAGCPP